MNRRELAKNGFLALCGALLGKLFKTVKADTLQLAFHGTDTNSATATYYVWNGAWQRLCPESSNYYGFDLSGPEWDDGYSLSDGTEIEHGTR